MAETLKQGEMEMNKLIKKIACAVMAFTLIAGVFTGCKANGDSSTSRSASRAATTAALPAFTSVKDESGNLPEKGTVGNMTYGIMGKDEFGCYNKDRGYYVDMLDQPNSPYFIVITEGTKTTSGADIRISDFGMQDSKLVIVVEEYKASGEKYTGLECPCAVLELDQMPAELLIVSTTGEEFNAI